MLFGKVKSLVTAVWVGCSIKLTVNIIVRTAKVWNVLSDGFCVPYYILWPIKLQSKTKQASSGLPRFIVDHIVPTIFVWRGREKSSNNTSRSGWSERLCQTSIDQKPACSCSYPLVHGISFVRFSQHLILPPGGIEVKRGSIWKKSWSDHGPMYI